MISTLMTALTGALGAWSWLIKALVLPALVLVGGWYVVDKIGDARERKLKEQARAEIERKNKELRALAVESASRVAQKDEALRQVVAELEAAQRDAEAARAKAAAGAVKAPTPPTQPRLTVTKEEAERLRRLLAP